jgi:hypothetical protein
VIAVLAVVGVLVFPSTPAAAHPSRHAFLVNQYAGLTFSPDRVRVTAALNTTEIVTRQDRQTVDADHDGTVTDAERARYSRTACAHLAAEFDVQVNGERLSWTAAPGDYRYEPGAAGLPHARLTCHLAAPARLSAPATVTIANRHRLDQPGWRELTATGDGVRLVDSRLPQHSVSDELRAIPPADALVLDVRTATVRVEPGPATTGAPGTAGAARGGPVAATTTWAERDFAQLVGGRLTPLLAILAVLVAVLLGAGHAALPGHGKTVLAAYLAGRRGRKRDAVAIGATVDMSQALIVGPDQLAVEGPADVAYLTVMSDLARAKGKAALDPRWTITPVGGLDKIPTFVALLGGSDLNVTVLMDVAAGGNQKLTNMIQRGLLLPKEHLIPLTDITGTTEADIEDLFEANWYLKLLKESKVGTFAKTELSGGGRIVKQVEAALGGRFDHYQPASYLMRSATKLRDEVDDATIERFAQLFGRINSLLSS